MKSLPVLLVGVFFLLTSCQPNTSSDYKDALTFYVSFDNGTTADFALGDANIYTAKATYANSRRSLDSIQVGMHNANHRIVERGGLIGDAFEFGEKSGPVLFYNSKDNLVYNPQNWSGTISFWLSVDPATELDGYTDPIQITDTDFNDASIWVDFTDADPPDFRLGVIGDRSAWTQDTLSAPVKDVFEKRIVNVGPYSFSRNTWTHVLITYDSLGTTNSLANLYLDGEKMGEVGGVDDPFTLELENAKIFLGLGFSGLMDELSVFNMPLTDEQVMALYQLEGGIKSIL
ncbi:MAG: LamG-like jellyroll fold domain-containing protein [Rhodothermales bacterium]